MRTRRRFHWHRQGRTKTAPPYLFPPVVSAAVFDPTLRRAGDILRGSRGS
jgi:hypothetical protein